MKPFIRVAEIWAPSTDASLLELSAGLFERAPAFGAISRKMCFGRDEGLPGKAWEEGKPLLLPHLEGSFFRRTAAAQAAGLRCAVALPIFVRGKLTCVVVLLCGESTAHVGALELWRNDPRVSGDLKLAEGYFGSTDKSLEELTRDGSLSRGAGAPGLAWQREASVFVENVSESSSFVRSQTASEAGILRALSIPCSAKGTETWILNLLASEGSPVALRVESWLPDSGGSHLLRAYGFCETEGRLSSKEVGAIPAEAAGPIALAWRSGAAQVFSGKPAELSAQLGRDALPSVLSSILVIPVVTDDSVSELVALYF